MKGVVSIWAPLLCYLSFGVNETTGGNVLSYSYLVRPDVYEFEILLIWYDFWQSDKKEGLPLVASTWS